MTEELATDDFEEEFEDEESETDEISATGDGDGDENDNVGDPSVEINVESLIRELEADGYVDRIDREKTTRKRLEELMERKRAIRELEDFDDYEI
jgi:hypothetical protein